MQPAKVKISSAMVCFDSGWRSIEEIVAIAEKAAAASLSAAPEFRAAIARGADFIDRRLAEDGVIYGVTTGFGDSCTVAVEPALIAELPRHLYTFHGCGLGAHFTPSETRAVIATRLTSLCKGFSGVIKRHNFSSNRATHGNSRSHNTVGSISMAQDPGRVFPGKKMPGHMGAVKRTVQSLMIVRIDEARQLLLISGGVPGSRGGDVIVSPAKRAKKPAPAKAPAAAADAKKK